MSQWLVDIWPKQDAISLCVEMTKDSSQYAMNIPVKIYQPGPHIGVNTRRTLPKRATRKNPQSKLEYSPSNFEQTSSLSEPRECSLFGLKRCVLSSIIMQSPVEKIQLRPMGLMKESRGKALADRKKSG
jgi:hypothetical protein